MYPIQKKRISSFNDTQFLVSFFTEKEKNSKFNMKE